MKHCTECGAELTMKYLESEGKDIPYCPACAQYRFPIFNTAVSMIVKNKTEDKIILIKQYGRDSYVLVAGYINKGEDAETTVVREVKEELGLDVIKLHFNHSHYFGPSNTLMLNFTAVVEDEGVNANEEIDAYQWFSIEDARKNILPNSLAQDFLYGYLDGVYSFH